MLYKARNSVIEFFDDYSSMVSEAKLKATKETEPKMLTPKQKLQRLPIALWKRAIEKVSNGFALNEIAF